MALTVWLLVHLLNAVCFAMVRRAEGPFFWLSGVHRDVLAGLPQFQGTEAPI
jgi:hypothetical protein